MPRSKGIGELIRPLWPFCVNLDSPQAQGLVRWWPLGYQPGNEFDLMAGQALTNTGSTVTAGGIARFRRTFSGSGQFLSGGHAAVTEVPLSLAAFHIDAVSGTTRTLMSISSGAATEMFQLRTDGSERANARTVGGGVNGSGVSSTSWTNDVIAHGLAVFPAVDSRSAFVNGAGKGTNTNSVTPSGINTTDIGQEGGGAAGTRWLGDLFDCRIYNRALTDLEAASYFSDHRFSLDLYYPLGRRSWSFPKRTATFKPYPRPRGLEAGLSVMSGGMQ